MNDRIEAIVRRLFADEEFRQAAVKDAAGVLEQYELSEVERKAIRRLCASLAGDAASTSHIVEPLTWT